MIIQSVTKVLYKAYSPNLGLKDRWTTGNNCFADLIQNYFEDGLQYLMGLEIVAYAHGEAKEHLKRGLAIKKAGNEIIRLLGGREVHPINVKVGGFYTLPTKRDLLLLKEKLASALEDVHKTIEWVNGFQFQDVTKEYECVALSHPAEYPMSRGVIASISGLAVAPKAFDATFTEEQVPYSNALHTVMNNKGAYLVGPMARYNLNSKKLPKRVPQAISAIGFEPICTNTSRSIIVRALEVLFAFDEAIRIIDQYDQEKMAPSYAAKTCAATGFAATEAPRGLLYQIALSSCC